MAFPICPLFLLCRFMKRSLLIISLCAAAPLNGFRKNGNCRTLKQKWHVSLTFCVWMWTTRTIIIWNRLTLVINLGMCTKLNTGWVSTNGAGIFYFGATALSLSMQKYLQKICKERKVNPTRHYYFWCMVFLAKIDAMNFGDRNHLVSEVQCQGISNKDWSTPTNTVLACLEKENKWQDRKQNIDIVQSISARKSSYKKPFVTKAPKVTDNAMQLGCALAIRLNNENTHWTKSVTGSGVSWQLCWWKSGEKFIAQIQNCILCNVKLSIFSFSHKHNASWRQAKNHIIGEISFEQGKKHK